MNVNNVLVAFYIISSCFLNCTLFILPKLSPLLLNENRNNNTKKKLRKYKVTHWFKYNSRKHKLDH